MICERYIPKYHDCNSVYRMLTLISPMQYICNPTSGYNSSRAIKSGINEHKKSVSFLEFQCVFRINFDWFKHILFELLTYITFYKHIHVQTYKLGLSLVVFEYNVNDLRHSVHEINQRPSSLVFKQ